jgi:hypothetical protein
MTDEAYSAYTSSPALMAINDALSSPLGKTATMGAGFLGGPIASGVMSLANISSSPMPASELGKELTGKAIGTIAGPIASSVGRGVFGATGSLPGAMVSGYAPGHRRWVGLVLLQITDSLEMTGPSARVA